MLFFRNNSKVPNVVFIGPTCSGKGTVARKISELYGHQMISAGRMLREKSAQDEALRLRIANGHHVSNEEIIPLIKSKMDSLGGAPCILDGFPRTLGQLQSLLSTKNDFIFIVLQIKSVDTLIQRAKNRHFCFQCDASFLPKTANCDICGSKLDQRADDGESEVIKKLDFFNQHKREILEIINKDHMVLIDAEQQYEKVLEDTIRFLESKINKPKLK